MEQLDSELIREYIAGDERAFTRLTERHVRALYNFIYRLVGNAHDTQDIVQETFIKAWRNIHKYHTNQGFKTWLFTIGRNTAIDHLRKKRPLMFSDFETDTGENILENTVADPSPLPDELVARAQNKDFIENILSHLPLEDREILLLRYNEDLPFEDISTILKKPLNTVKSKHRRALLKIHALLAGAPK